MKRLSTALVALLLTSLGLALTTPGPALAAARRKSHDTPGCVDKKEYRAIRSGMTAAQVQHIADIPGATVRSVDNGYYDGAWVDDGYWEDFGYWDEEYDPITDTFSETYVPDEEWIDTSYYDATADWVPMVDTVRTYKKCKSFQHGRSRVGINFDDYTHGDGLHVFVKTASNPQRLVAVVDTLSSLSARHAAGKHLPVPHARPAEPHFKPLTPKPLHPRPRTPEPTRP